MKRSLFSFATLLVATALALGACSSPNPQTDTVKSQPPAQTDGSLQSDYSGGDATVANGPYRSNSEGQVEAFSAEEAPAPASGLASGGGGAQAPVAADQNAQSADNRLVIKTATLSVVVDDPAKTVEAITKLTSEMGGFVVNLNTSKSTYGPQAQVAESASMTIRVPSDKLDDALAQLKGLAVEVNNESVAGEDVTSEYTDLKSRLTNLEAAEKQLQSIMEEATKTEDVLAVYNQLVSTREQIEVLKGQMKYYEESSAMSAITLDIQPNIVTQPIEVGGWHPEGAAKQAIEDTVRFLQSATDELIYFSIARLPFLLIFGIPTLLVLRWLWRRSRKPAAPKPQPEPAATGD